MAAGQSGRAENGVDKEIVFSACESYLPTLGLLRFNSAQIVRMQVYNQMDLKSLHLLINCSVTIHLMAAICS